MKTRSFLIPVLAMLTLTACARDTIREMGSLKDDAPHRQSQAAEHDAADRKAAAAATSEESRSAPSEAAAQGENQLETGSISKTPSCQGEHIAYQATKEYLKNFGPKPAPVPGELGPCRPAQ